MNAIAHTATAALQPDPMSGLQRWLASGAAEPAASRAFKVHVLMDGETIEITQPLRHQLLCSQGTLWITHDGWPADHIVEQGQCYLAAIGARMLVHALGDARVRVSQVRA